MYTVSGAQINGMYAFYTADSSTTMPTVSSEGALLTTILQNVVSAGGGAIRIHNLSEGTTTANSETIYQFTGNTAINNIDHAGGLLFSAGVVIRAVGLANLKDIVNSYNYGAHVATAQYTADTIFSYAPVTANGTVPANGAVTLTCEVEN